MSYNKVQNKLQKFKNFYKSKKLKNVAKPVLKKNKFKPISEKRSRDWRFRCLARLYIAKNYNVLFTGHTATDRAETALLQLIRGTSLHGITSFKFNKNYKSVYPKYYNYSNFFYRFISNDNN